MSDKRDGKTRRRVKGIDLSEWSLRRKLALVLAAPLVLASVLGGLRVNSELTKASNDQAVEQQVTVLRPAVDYLAATEYAAIVSRLDPFLGGTDRAVAIDSAAKAGAALKRSRAGAHLTPAENKQLDVLLNLSVQLRSSDGYESAGQSVSQIRTLASNVTELINTVIDAQITPEPKLTSLQQVLDGRLSLAMQQFQVAYNNGDQANSIQLAAELGVEQAAISRLQATFGLQNKQVQALSQQNAQHFGVVSSGGHNLGDDHAFEPYNQLSNSLLNGISRDLVAAANHSRALALVNGLVTLLALLVAVGLTLMVSRLLLNPIRRVREGALKVATEQLPEAVARIRSGGDPGRLVPIDVSSNEEIGQLARAVDELHREAVNLAAGEAKVRAQVGDMFVTLSRRNTSLINQQLGLIENLERDEEDPQRLEALFRLDHLASRMRRTAESLVVLSDAPVANAGEQAGLSVNDALQAAIAGVQDYQRVEIATNPVERLTGAAAGDVIHLFTELVDNALAYSPPTAPVRVSTSTSRAGTVVEISDAGLGIAADDLAVMNAGLHSGGEVTAETARRMGLLVVSRLAERHGVSVALDQNERGGTTATVRLPATILRNLPSSAALDQAAFSRPATAPTPAPAASNGSTPHQSLSSEPTTRPATPAVAANGARPGAPVEQDVDQIEAAINAVIRLPQRRPGSSDIPGAPAAPAANGEGGSLFQRFTSREDRAAAAAAKAETPAEPAPAETVEVPAAVEAAPVAESEPVAETQPAAETQPVAETQPAAESETVVEPDLDPAVLEPASLEHLSAQAEATALAATESLVADQVDVVPAVLPVAPPPAEPAAPHAVLEASTPAPDGDEEEPPIFRSVRSNWFSSGGDDQAWSNAEADAGWEAADRVTETPLTRSESGLPMRQRGNRLVPGGLSSSGPVATPAAAATSTAVRDPEAIRRRLAAHAAGVSRGRRSAAETETIPHPVQDAEQEAGPA